MAGIKISSLPVDNNLYLDDSFLKIKNGSAYQVNGSAFYASLTGVNQIGSVGGGQSIVAITTQNATGTSVNFYSLCANSGLQANLNANAISYGIANAGVTNNMLNVWNTTNNGVTYSVANYVNSGPTINAGLSAMLPTLSATVVPNNTTSIVLLQGYISLGTPGAAVTIYRTVNGTTTPLNATNNPSQYYYPATLAAVYDGQGFNPTAVPINFVDTPNTTSSVTYTIGVQTVNYSGWVTHVNYGYAPNGTHKYNVAASSQIAAIVLN